MFPIALRNSSRTPLGTDWGPTRDKSWQRWKRAEWSKWEIWMGIRTEGFTASSPSGVNSSATGINNDKESDWSLSIFAFNLLLKFSETSVDHWVQHFSLTVLKVERSSEPSFISINFQIVGDKSPSEVTSRPRKRLASFPKAVFKNTFHFCKISVEMYFFNEKSPKVWKSLKNSANPSSISLQISATWGDMHFNFRSTSLLLPLLLPDGDIVKLLVFFMEAAFQM